MKIVLVHNSYRQPGGEDTVFNNERSLLQKAGHEVTCYYRSNLETDNQGAMRLAANTIWSDASAREFGQLLRRHRPDVVHVHNTFFVISAAIYSACKKLRIPVVQTLHNYRLICPAATLFRNGRVCHDCSEHSLWRGVWHGCYHQSRVETGVVAAMLKTHRLLGTWSHMIDTYIALTEYSRHQFISAGLPAEKIVVKPNFVERDPGDRSCAGSYVLFAGRLTKEKGVETLLAAWERLPRDIPLYVAGEGPLRPVLQERAERAGLKRISFLGHQSREALEKLMKAALFVVFPSEWPEHFPLVTIESFACGAPLLVSDLKSLQDIVSPRTGIVFRAGDTADLAEKALYAWNHPAYTHALGRNARLEYLACYTGEKNLPMLIQIYERTIASRATALRRESLSTPEAA